MLKRILSRLRFKKVVQALAPLTAIRMLKQNRQERPLLPEIGTACPRRGAVRRWLLVNLFSAILLVLIGSWVVIGRLSGTTPLEEIEDFARIQFEYLANQWRATEKIGTASDAPERPILVIDLTAGEIRLERPGNVTHPAENLKFPEGWKWEAVCWDRTGSSPLSDPIRLRVRTEWKMEGLSEKRIQHNPPEQIELRGTHRTGKKVCFVISSWDMTFKLDFQENSNLLLGQETDSISERVNDSEYETAHAAWTQMAQSDTVNTSSSVMETHWASFQTQLAKQLRAHLKAQDWEEIRLTVRPNPDLQRGYLLVEAKQLPSRFSKKPVRLMSQGREHNGYDLQYLGGTTWALLGNGILAGDNMALSGNPQEKPEIWHEALTRAQAERDEWLKHLRTWDPRFTAKLNDGTRMELIGLSEHATWEAKWWRPDGTPLGWQPYVIPEKYNSKPSRNHEIAYAFRITPSPSGRFEVLTGCLGGESYPPVSPWGWEYSSQESDISGQVAFFSTDQNTADFYQTLVTPNGSETTLVLRNVALYADHPTSITIQGTDLKTSDTAISSPPISVPDGFGWGTGSIQSDTLQCTNKNNPTNAAKKEGR